MQGWRERPRGEGRIGVGGVVMLVGLCREKQALRLVPCFFVVGI